MRVSRSEVSCSLLDPARQLRHRREGDVLVARRQRAAAGAAAHERVARRRPATCHEERRDSTSSPARAPARARPCAVRVRRSSSGAIDRCQLDAASSRSAGRIVTCTSFSASANVAADTGGPLTGPCRTSAARRAWWRCRGRRRRQGVGPEDGWSRRSASAGGGEHAERSREEELSAGIHDVGSIYHVRRHGGLAGQCTLASNAVFTALPAQPPTRPTMRACASPT